MGQGDAALPADPYRQRTLCCLAQREHLLLSPLVSCHPVELHCNHLPCLSVLLQVPEHMRNPPVADNSQRAWGIEQSKEFTYSGDAPPAVLL